MEIMRSPEYLMLLTTSSIDQYENRFKKTKEEEAKKVEEEKNKEKEKNKDNKDNKDKK